MPEAKKYPTPELNLLSGNDYVDQSQGKVLHWALTWGKRIVVLTELVVICAFLSRFWLDTTVTDLNEQLTQKKSIVKASSESEKRFRLLQTRMENATKIENTVSVLSVYDLTQSLIPSGVILTQLNVSRKDIALTGSATEPVLAQLVNSFKQSKEFTDLSVDRISKKGIGDSVDFSLKALYASK